MASNEFWGKRSGTITSKGDRIFKGRRASQTKKENSKPVGKKAKKHARYSNPKIARKYGVAR